LIGRIWPLFLFSAPGAAVFVGGLVLGYWVVQVQMTTGYVAIGSAILTIGLVVSGMMTFFAGLILYAIYNR
jgi:hypothetical protein